MEENKEDVLSKNLKFLRNAYGYTQEQIIRLLGIPKADYLRYEKGNDYITIEVLQKLASLYNVKEFDMLTCDLETTKDAND